MFSFFWFLFVLLLKLLFCLAFIYSFLTHFMLWIEWRTQQLQTPSHFKIGSWQSLALSFLVEGTCHFICALFYPFAKLSAQIPRNQEGIPILLIPGYLHTKHDFLWFQHHLQAIPGMGPIYSMNLLPYAASLNEHAKRVKQKIAEIKMQTGHAKVILIGHSRGGLVASVYAEFFSKEKEEIAAIICIGSPFRGTRAAVLGTGNSAKELTINAPNLSALCDHILNSSVDYYYVASQSDNMIIPWQSAFPLAHIEKNTFILKNIGHLRLLISRPIINQIAEWVLKIK